MVREVVAFRGRWYVEGGQEMIASLRTPSLLLVNPGDYDYEYSAQDPGGDVSNERCLTVVFRDHEEGVSRAGTGARAKLGSGEHDNFELDRFATASSHSTHCS